MKCDQEALAVAGYCLNADNKSPLVIGVSPEYGIHRPPVRSELKEAERAAGR
jgi:hypothetical protein